MLIRRPEGPSTGARDRSLVRHVGPVSAKSAGVVPQSVVWVDAAVGQARPHQRRGRAAVSLVDLGEEELWGCPITSQHVVDAGCHYRVAEWAPVVEGGASPRVLDCVGDEQAGC